MERPTFLTTKGERKRSVYQYDPVERYKQIAKGIYTWENLPEDVPEGYIEECIFNYGAASAKNVDGIGICVMAAAARTYNIYGEPLTWLPTGISMIPKTLNIMQESDNPVLFFGTPIIRRIEIFAGIMKSALISLQQNVIALRQPIALDGAIGNSAEACILSNELEEGEMYIPVIDGERLGVKVIDLQSRDYTQTLIATYNAMDNEILTILGVKNTGTEKKSGITPEETLSITQELTLTSDIGLKIRKNWCNKINNVLGTNFDVYVSDAYTQQNADNDNIPDTLEKEQEEL